MRSVSSPVVPPSLSACECGTAYRASLPGVLSAWLPVSTPPAGLDECFFFNSLVVGLLYSLIFWQFWFFVFKFGGVLLLVVQGGTVCPPTPPSWPEGLTLLNSDPLGSACVRDSVGESSGHPLAVSFGTTDQQHFWVLGPRQPLAWVLRHLHTRVYLFRNSSASQASKNVSREILVELLDLKNALGCIHVVTVVKTT